MGLLCQDTSLGKPSAASAQSQYRQRNTGGYYKSSAYGERRKRRAGWQNLEENAQKRFLNGFEGYLIPLFSWGNHFLPHGGAFELFAMGIPGTMLFPDGGDIRYHCPS
jgi:hypothetical protein